MCRLTAPPLLLLALALAACGGSGSHKSTVASSPGSTGSSGPRSGARAPARAAPKPRPNPVSPPRTFHPSSFDPASVRVSFLEKSFFGAKSQVTYFIAKAAAQNALAQAKACVARTLRKAPSAYCFAFSSERAFRFSQVSSRPPAKIKRPCWIAYWGKPSGRRAIGSGSNGAAVPLHCPDVRN
jgi:hypothetical protein